MEEKLGNQLSEVVVEESARVSEMVESFLQNNLKGKAKKDEVKLQQISNACEVLKENFTKIISGCLHVTMKDIESKRLFEKTTDVLEGFDEEDREKSLEELQKENQQLDEAILETKKEILSHKQFLANSDQIKKVTIEERMGSVLKEFKEFNKDGSEQLQRKLSEIKGLKRQYLKDCEVADGDDMFSTDKTHITRPPDKNTAFHLQRIGDHIAHELGVES